MLTKRKSNKTSTEISLSSNFEETVTIESESPAKPKRYVPPEHSLCAAMRPENQRFASVVTVVRECYGLETIITRYCTCGFCYPQSEKSKKRPITHKDVEIVKHN